MMTIPTSPKRAAAGLATPTPADSSSESFQAPTGIAGPDFDFQHAVASRIPEQAVSAPAEPVFTPGILRAPDSAFRDNHGVRTTACDLSVVGNGVGGGGGVEPGEMPGQGALGIVCPTICHVSPPPPDSSPLSDTAFLRLPAAERTAVTRRIAAVKSIAAADNKSRAATALAGEWHDRGMSAKRLLTLYYAWANGTDRYPAGDWRHLMRHSVAGPAYWQGGGRRRTAIPLDRDTVEHFVSLEIEYQRKSREAYRKLVRTYRAGDPIPGLPPGTDRRKLPAGWSYSNFMARARQIRGKWDLVAARIGRIAAADHRPKVLTTRVGLEVGQYYLFDDMWHDFQVVAIGQRRPMRLLQLHALDLFSGCQFARGLKPRMEDPETGKRINLTEDEMLFLLVHVLQDFGWRGAGCTLMVEHGTAAIRDDVEAALSDITGGQVSVQRSGVERVGSIAGLYGPVGRGNFRFKAHLESLGNLIHNATAGVLEFPGQVGANSRISKPEEEENRSRQYSLLQRVLVALPPALIQQLCLPYLEERKACDLINEVMERVNRRDDHDLEGWERAGLTTVDYELPGVGRLPQSHVLALEPVKRQAVVAAATPVARRLSPREVWDRGAGRLTRLRPEQAAALLCGRHGQEVAVKGGLIEFCDRAISPDPLRYKAHTLADGTKFRAVVNPFSAGVVHLFDAVGRWCGACEAWGPVGKSDTAALHRQMGQAAHVERLWMDRLAPRAERINRARLTSSTRNAEVLRQAVEKPELSELLAASGL